VLRNTEDLADFVEAEGQSRLKTAVDKPEQKAGELMQIKVRKTDQPSADHGGQRICRSGGSWGDDGGERVPRLVIVDSMAP